MQRRASARLPATRLSGRRGRRCSRSPSGSRARSSRLRRAVRPPACARSGSASKSSMPLVSQPSSVSSALPLQAAGTAGTEPNQAARSPCSFGLTASAPATCRRSSGAGRRRASSWCRPSRSRLPRGSSLAIGCFSRLQQVDLERPGRGGDDALVLEVVDLDHGVVPVAADELALLRAAGRAPPCTGPRSARRGP